LHAGMLVTGGHVGAMPDEVVLQGQELMAKAVMPHFRAAPTPEPSRPVEVSAGAEPASQP
ncbi:MAG: hypothetical protein ACRDHP_00130, partial [Ktedonobacterales bacterium]